MNINNDFRTIFINIFANKIDINKINSIMNNSMTLNNRLESNILIKADDISTDKTNKIRTKNKIMNKNEENFKSSKNEKKINKNFLRKQFIKENNNFKNGQEEKECLFDDFSKNHVFQYYYSTIEYLQKYYNFYMNNEYNNNISKNNTLNINNDYSYDINLYIKTSNIKKNNNHFFVKVLNIKNYYLNE